MHNSSYQKQFQNILASQGFKLTGPIVPDGIVHRIYEYGGKPGNLDGWYSYHDGAIPYAVFGSWKEGITRKWCAGDITKLTSVERKRIKQLEKAAAKSAEALKIERQHYASWRARKIWSKSFPANPMHPYLVNKGVQPHGLRQRGDRLLVPFYANGQLTTLQFISPDGQKRWLSEGMKKTACYALGMGGDIVCIAEGYATGASVYQSKGYTTFIAGDAGNLRWVAESIRYALPNVKIILCADNDANTPGNPGVKKAKEAAAAVGGYVAIAGEHEARF